MTTQATKIGMTPSALEVLIHAHVSPQPHPRADAPAVQQAQKDFVRLGVFEPYPQRGVFRTTSMGAAWLEQICSVPMPELKEIRCAVFAYNSQGSPDIWYCKVRGTWQQIEDGDHYHAASKAAVDAGYEPRMVADEDDDCGPAVMEHMEWATITEVVKI